MNFRYHLLRLSGAICYIELGTSILEPGCDFAYTVFVGWEGLAFAFMWVSVLMTYPASAAVQAQTFGQYIGIIHIFHYLNFELFLQILLSLRNHRYIWIVCALLFTLQIFFPVNGLVPFFTMEQPWHEITERSIGYILLICCSFPNPCYSCKVTISGHHYLHRNILLNFSSTAQQLFCLY
uniref:7TM_GPCR_Srx domain-containing protein n=1 Tax=Heterorhabditis bacteriophora TaxID=37862 RepID=A0A1I7W8B3_HETBA